MRDRIKDSAHFEKLIVELNNSISFFKNKIQAGDIKPERIGPVKQSIASSYISLVVSKYSYGISIPELVETYNEAAYWVNESWNGSWKLRNQKGEELNQYILSAYDEMVWMLSLGYLMNVTKDTFRKLVDVIDRDSVKDLLFEFIVRAKLPERIAIEEESYDSSFRIPEIFSELRKAITLTDNTVAEDLTREFITKKWYPNHKQAAWFNNHNSKYDSYVGYWSFETAAVVKIMGLDDSSFRDCQYYPKDLL